MKYTFRAVLLLALGVFMNLPSAMAQTEVSIGPARSESPKTVVFNPIYTEEGTFNGKRLATPDLGRISGSTIVLEQDGVELVSSPIEVKDSHGACTIRNVLPGKYILKSSALGGVIAGVFIPAWPVNTVTLEMKLSGGGVPVSIKLHRK